MAAFCLRGNGLLLGALLTLTFGLAPGAKAQPDEPAAPATTASTNTPVLPPAVTPVTPEPQDKRILGVLPNYRTADGTVPFEPITAKQKFGIAMKDSFDWPNYLVSGGFALLYQAENTNPSFGQGVKGYLHRYITSYADQSMGNLMTEGLIPTLLHEDPRYFRKVTGSKWSRTGYALTRILVTRTDSGGTRFNFSEVVGNGAMAAIGNLYYPDDRGFSDTTERLGTQLLTDAGSNLLKEFWPDLKRRFFHKHNTE